MAMTEGPSRTRSVWMRIIPPLVVISLLGMLVLIIADIAGVEGTDERDPSVWWLDLSWLCYSIGAILALVGGIAALFRARQVRNEQDRRAGLLGVGWFVVAAVIGVIGTILL